MCCVTLDVVGHGFASHCFGGIAGKVSANLITHPFFARHIDGIK